jgi:soluble lytic murein transglycosylase
VDSASGATAEARIALRQQSSAAPALLAAVPEEMRSEPGLVYEQARWLRRTGNQAAARRLLAAHPVDAVRPEPFWAERSLLARSALSEAGAGEAYRVASTHGLASGREFADAEWLSGWIALRFMQQPEPASTHFLTLFENVSHPVSRARGAYWSARASAQAGDAEAAMLWHRAAAQHAVAFYGQLSAAEIRPGEPLRLPSDPPATPAEARSFQTHPLTRAVRLLAATGELEAQRAFLLRLGEAGDTAGWKDLTASLAYEIGRPDLAVFVARQSIRAGAPLVRNGYPVVAIPDGGSLAQPVETPLLLAVIRQESSFDPRALSPAGAKGLMQLMPGTARSVASGLGLGYSPASLTESPDYNISLGRAYLASMLSRFGGSYVLSLAAYNAGPGRVNQWLRSNGDPRLGEDAAVDWIELIPFNETRNYVQRCLENLQVYRARSGALQLAQTDGGLLR